MLFSRPLRILAASSVLLGAAAHAATAVRTDDAALIAEVRTALAKVSGIDLQSTKIEAQRGVVSIVGIVSTPEVVRRANDAVKRIPGIQKIDNRLVSGEQMGWD